ncbi:MAG TPA: CoA-binding protein [Flavisolibacter sp.]|nr:CoA-binding protein [Flavisolibacter sp.]
MYIRYKIDYMMINEKKTLVLGASDNPSRYSYMAMNRLQAHNHPVVAVGKREGEVAGVLISRSPVQEKDIDTITLYLNPTHQKEYYDYIIGLQPKRIIFNPGTENPELMKMAREKGIQPVVACTLVMLATGQY